MALLQQEKSKESEVEQMVENMPMTMGDPVAAAAAASIVFSWYQYYIKGNKEYGIFTGLWAPTLLAGASYLQQKELMRKSRKVLSSF